MDLAGKTLLIRLHSASAAALVRESAGATHVLGEVEGETRGIGLWIRLVSIVSDQAEFLSPDPDRTILVRWEWISQARRIDQPGEPETIEELRREFGFRQR
jgi:hypothetical protein